MAHIVKKSPWPVYAVGLVWLVFGLFLPLYKLIHFLAAAGLSIAAYLVVKKLCPDKTFTVPDPEPEPEPATTGSPELDELIRQRDLALSEMHRLNDSIEDPKISAQIDHMEAVTAKIIAHVVEHPRKLPQIRKFLNYYLPTTLKLLNAYDRMNAAGVSGANIDGTMGKIGRAFRRRGPGHLHRHHRNGKHAGPGGAGGRIAPRGAAINRNDDMRKDAPI